MEMGHTMNVVIYQIPGRRSATVCDALRRGCGAFGHKSILLSSSQFERPTGDVAAFYGLKHGNLEIMRQYHEAGLKTVYVDLGYWCRLEGGRYNGYHKVAVNGMHPSTEQLSFQNDSSRALSQGIMVKKEQPRGQAILLAGMSSKSSWANGFHVEQWEKEAVKQLNVCTARPIWYRPKPSWTEAKPIDGTIFRDVNIPIEQELEIVHAVATHHSNVAIDALISGVPYYTEIGGAKELSACSLCCLESAKAFPMVERQTLLNKLAHCHWNIEEIANGLMWKHLAESGAL